MKSSYQVVLVLFFMISTVSFSQSKIDKILTEISTATSAQRIENDIKKLVSFGTRHTLSDTVSNNRGIGAARRWIKSAFEEVSTACNNCLEVSYLGDIVKADGRRIITDTKVVNVLAIQRGTKYPNHYVIMSGDIDSRVSDANNFTSDSPGANDNATGMAGTIEASRVLSKYKFPVSIIYVGLSGEEQGLFGGKIMANYAKEHNWNIIGVLNNDMIGNIEGIDGVIDNSTFRVFSEAISMETTDREKASMRFYGGEVDGPSRQLARRVDQLTDAYMTNLDAIMIYRLDRFGRGGHHRPFNDAGFTGVRIMETHENYNRQHQDIRVENGIKYGDVMEGVNFDYAAKLTAVNCLTLASIAAAPPAPENVMIAGAVQPSTRLKWDPIEDDAIIGYKIYWRDTTSPQWQYSRFVGNTADYTLKNIVIDNYLFGVASVSESGAESLIQFPRKQIPSGM
ncbi:M28 family metallopeptidase [Lutibacter flavus]|uniref:Peptidase family M28 n=1 Tax=Lutibacter flavus TaxID=691689 RepID=A0A238VH13_9FLAO|nr:M28 family metallopeptidase [Lutibacter flavus]SNR33491.1 Peptidase family M28 [Lutibacter flavus]